MFGMNAKDWDASDDMDASRRRTNIHIQAINQQGRFDRALAVTDKLVIIVKDRNQSIEQLQKKLADSTGAINKLERDRAILADDALNQINKGKNVTNDVKFAAYASVVVMKQLIRDYCAVTDEAIEEVTERINAEKNKIYHECVSGALEQGELTEDPRNNPELYKKRPWYSPAP